VIFQRLFGRKKPDPSDALYAAIVAAARQEKFYAKWQVPDTLDGRFDMMIVHMYLVLDRLRVFGVESEELRQALTDRFFAEMDKALREIGVGDISVGKKVRKMAESFFGRITAYSTAISESEVALSAALQRNVFAGTDTPQSDVLARWMLAAHEKMAEHGLADFQTGHVRFE
jgi:cytochrome b pre-mRNA-processing protein 3